MANAVYFASDLHLGAGNPARQRERVALFTGWLESLTDASHLYLLGDVFDFWMDYPSYMPKAHFEVLYGLRRLRERGAVLRFVGGNHDVWCAQFLRDELGFEILDSGSVVEHQGRRLRLHHGDGLLSGDRSYELFRRFVRHPAIIFLAKSLHPELLYRLACWLSHKSRENDRDDPDALRRLLHDWGLQHPQSDVDYLVIGHFHLPQQDRFDGWSLHCLGDWVQHDTAARLADGALRIVHVREELAIGS
jgi:UDP-2,3-diacylglucosamine hydrolase